MKNFTSYFLDYSIDSTIERCIEKGLDLILSHLSKPYWPRTISTKRTEGRQFTVYSRLEALSYFKDSNYLDCRISAYNPDNKIVNFIMIDLDQSNFKSRQELDRAKTKTLSKISGAFQVRRKIKLATVIWSGNGYHCYIPADSQGKILEKMSEFKKLVKEPSKEFLRFAEWYLSKSKCDNEHNKTVSFNNCMLRIPGSFNSKNNVQVQVIQKWNGTSKASAHLLYGKFLAYIVDKGQISTKHRSKTYITLSENASLSQLNVVQRFYQRRNKKKFIPWIERLLKTPIPDHRKYCIWRVLAPYLINVKHLTFEEAFDIIDKWLDKCNDLEPLDFDTETKVNDCLNSAVNKGYLPISLDNPDKEPKTLKTDKRELYTILVAKKQIKCYTQ